MTTLPLEDWQKTDDLEKLKVILSKTQDAFDVVSSGSKEHLAVQEKVKAIYRKMKLIKSRNYEIKKALEKCS